MPRDGMMSPRGLPFMMVKLLALEIQPLIHDCQRTPKPLAWKLHPESPNQLYQIPSLVLVWEHPPYEGCSNHQLVLAIKEASRICLLATKASLVSTMVEGRESFKWLDKDRAIISCMQEESDW